MRHRICDIGLGGNSDPEILENKWTENEELNELLKECFHESLNTFKFLKEEGWLDFTIDLKNKEIKFGIEPTYQYETLFIITIDLDDIGECSIEKGIAWGLYGSNIVSTTKYYKDYKNKCQFTKFIDKWFNQIKNIIEKNKH